jgi:hypothetical protein
VSPVRKELGFYIAEEGILQEQDYFSKAVDENTSQFLLK